ncbi:VOC family protein [Streptomyces albiaxialis]|uniref:VOC family protein n=1 Tax=Streptomyces albiaxialis TaxID=329523 RepID=A0ABN2VH41_9ACTN
MARMIFVNLPVKDLDRAKDFFTKLGYEFNPQFTDDNAGCLVLGENIYAMLLTEPFFQGFSKRDLPDNSRTTGAIVALSAESREEVDEYVDRALANGATEAGSGIDEGSMYGRSFHDPDGHLWEYMWMDPSAVEG